MKKMRPATPAPQTQQMRKIMNWLVDTALIALAIACMVFALTSCTKDDPYCQTCTVTATTQVSGQPLITAIESIDKYCNHEWDTLQSGLIYKKISQNGPTITTYERYRECKASH